MNEIPPPPEGFSPPVKGPLVFRPFLPDLDIIRYAKEKNQWLAGYIGTRPIYYSLRLGSEIYEKNKAMFEPEKKGHPHADLMMEYAKDAAETEKPWELWEYAYPDGIFRNLDYHPAWTVDYQYRRKPTPPKTININGIEVPEPHRKPLEMGQIYYTPKLLGTGQSHHELRWANTALDECYLSTGQVHLTAEAAAKHTEALLSFTRSDS